MEARADGICQKHTGVPSEGKESRSAIPLKAAVQNRAPAIEVPLTEAQMEIWLSAQLGDDASCAFNESFTLLMRGQLDAQAMRDSVQDLVNRHEALRATIIPERNSLHFSPQSQLTVRFDDLTSASPSEHTAALQNANQEEASTPFDLSNW